MIFIMVSCANEKIEQASEIKEEKIYTVKDKQIADQPVLNNDYLKENKNNDSEKRKKESSQKPNNDIAEEQIESRKENEKAQSAKGEVKSHTDSSMNEQQNKGANAIHVDSLLPNDVSESREKPITHIVLHFTSNAAITPQDPYNVADIRKTFIDYGVSAHYLVGREGQVYQLVPEDRVAYHAGKGNFEHVHDYEDQLNHYSIGREIMPIGKKEEMSSMMSSTVYDSIDPSDIGYTDAQYQTIEQLIDFIIDKNPKIKKERDHIVGHDEYAQKRKTDPGSLFYWSKIVLSSYSFL